MSQKYSVVSKIATTWQCLLTGSHGFSFHQCKKLWVVSLFFLFFSFTVNYLNYNFDHVFFKNGCALTAINILGMKLFEDNFNPLKSLPCSVIRSSIQLKINLGGQLFTTGILIVHIHPQISASNDLKYHFIGSMLSRGNPP